MSIAELEMYLIKTYDEARRANPRYSIRAMAQKHAVNPTTLRKVLRGERRLGFYLAKQIAAHYKIELQREPRRNQRHKKPWNVNGLNPGLAAQVSWMNLAILETIKLKDFQPTASWIAKQLNLPTATVETMLAEMETAGMLERKGAHWKDRLDDASVDNEHLITSDVVRAMIQDLILKSRQAVESVPYERREHGFMIIPVAAKDLPRLKTKLRAFRHEFSQSAQKSKTAKDSVYGLEVGFFPLTLGPEAELK